MLSIMICGILKRKRKKIKNKLVIEILEWYHYNIFQRHDIHKLLTILQLIIGLQTNDSKDSFNIKEFFAFEAARELCVFLWFIIIFFFCKTKISDTNMFIFVKKNAHRFQISMHEFFCHMTIKINNCVNDEQHTFNLHSIKCKINDFRKKHRSCYLFWYFSSNFEKR